MTETAKVATGGFTFPEEYAYVLAVAVGSVIINQYLTFKVVAARKKYDVKYPRLYHEDPEHVFNCVQRAHQNYLENIAVFLVVLFIGGLNYPTTAAALGALYLFSRVVYMAGYSTGNPTNRMWGAFGYAGFFPLLGMAVMTVLARTGIYPCKHNL